MKKVLFAIALLMGCTFHSYAQEVKRIDASLQDYVQLLETEGYKVYPFDISCLKGSKYTLRFEVKEYAGGQEKEIASEDYGKWGIAYGSDEDGYEYAGKVTVGFTPGGAADTVRYAKVMLENMGHFTVSMKLKPVENPLYRRPLYRYVARPFKPSAFEVGKFIPLVLYCSYWYDAKSGIVRACGEKEIDPLMTAAILKDSPHYYVIGFTVIETNF